MKNRVVKSTRKKVKQRNGTKLAVTVVGLGLIGGSIARDLRKAGVISRLTGVDSNKNNASRALRLGLVDRIQLLDRAIIDADVVILAAPVGVLQEILPRILNGINDRTIVIDTGSTKERICASVEAHPRRNQFVAAHPIAGTENSGPEAAIQGLFRNKMNIICERERSSGHALKIAEKIFKRMGMHITYMNPREHDKHVAYVSHLSHVSSFLLGQTVLDIERDEKNIFNLAGSGLASTVRLAKSSPDMWAPIFDQNKINLGKALEEYINHLQQFQRYLQSDDIAGMHAVMTRANEIRRVLDGIELKAKTKQKKKK